MRKELYERLAEVEHERWADWQKYIMSDVFKIVNNEYDIITLSMPIKQWEEWERLVNTRYKKLTDKEKNSDREQVDRYWHLIEYHIRRRLPTKKRRKKKKI